MSEECQAPNEWIDYLYDFFLPFIYNLEDMEDVKIRKNLVKFVGDKGWWIQFDIESCQIISGENISRNFSPWAPVDIEIGNNPSPSPYIGRHPEVEIFLSDFLYKGSEYDPLSYTHRMN